MTEIQESTKSNLWAALMEAQASITGVAKDAKNDWGKYGYTSAEEMIGQCRKALLAHGLAFARTHWDITNDMVHSHFILVHAASGETLEFGNLMQVVPSKNPDKSILAALTTVLNYTLRDLLLIPRVEDKQPEIDNRPADDMLASPPRHKSMQRPSAAKPSQIKPAPDWMVLGFNMVLGEKPDADEYTKRLLGAAEQKYGESFGSIADLPEDYLLKVFEHHGWSVSLEQETIDKESL